MIDPTGAIIVELASMNVASGRVRGVEPAPGDANGPGDFKRFVLIARLVGPREHRAPFQVVSLSVRAYAPTHQDAAALYGEVSDALDNIGPRLSMAGLPIYNTLDETGAASGTDPDTKQPFASGVIAVFAGTEVLGS